MRGMDIFCASPASTAICSSIDHRSMVRGGHRPIDSHHHHRNPKLPYAPCSSELPIIPRPFDYYRQYNHEKSRKSTFSYYKPSDVRRKSSADISDLRRSSTSSPSGDSSRYLLSDERDHRDEDRPSCIDWKLATSEPSDHHQYDSSAAAAALVPYDSIDDDNLMSSKPRLRAKNSSNNGRHSSGKVLVRSQSEKPRRQLSIVNGSSSFSPAALKSASTNRRSGGDQVVVLRVSIHCKGCEGKVRKHISKMEGVKSFSIDLAAKKVTVIGNVTPQGVLQSVSRVKKAQFWPSSMPTSSSPAPSSSSSSSTSLQLSIIPL